MKQGPSCLQKLSLSFNIIVNKLIFSTTEQAGKNVLVSISLSNSYTMLQTLRSTLSLLGSFRLNPAVKEQEKGSTTTHNPPPPPQDFAETQKIQCCLCFPSKEQLWLIVIVQVMPVRLGCHLSAQQIEAGTLRTQLAFPNRQGLPSYHRTHLHKPPSEGEQTTHCELLPGTAANLGVFPPSSNLLSHFCFAIFHEKVILPSKVHAGCLHPSRNAFLFKQSRTVASSTGYLEGKNL